MTQDLCTVPCKVLNTEYDQPLIGQCMRMWLLATRLFGSLWALNLSVKICHFSVSAHIYQGYTTQENDGFSLWRKMAEPPGKFIALFKVSLSWYVWWCTRTASSTLIGGGACPFSRTWEGAQVVSYDALGRGWGLHAMTHASENSFPQSSDSGSNKRKVVSSYTRTLITPQFYSQKTQQSKHHKVHSSVTKTAFCFNY